MTEETCVAEGCNRPVEIKLSKMCRKHYLREYKKGTHTRAVRWTNPDGTRMSCMFLGCDSPVQTRGLCGKHYQAANAGKKPPKGFRQTKWTNPDGTRMACTHEDCEEPIFVKGLCKAHYHANWKVGTDREPKPQTYCPVRGCGREKINRRDVCAKCNRDRWRYGLSVEDWIEMNLPENRVCSNTECKSVEILHVDHDHSCECQGSFGAKDRVSCGKCVRGWLCRSCNLGLGYFKDDPDLLRGIISYVENWKAPRDAEG